ncbi:CBS domain-containing protein [Parvibaculum sp.]|uniref:CBS domain-containing protein n=1 Tax=Parvibaculum sp. TaxID=2024848 RepID=UPI000C5CC3D3|nr:CBS domain-containing protein [Parvibaculum sp.]HAC57891.1 CBS domain-containing protein [Rhodobiaceae bacterium]MAU61908.1 inosine-5-monophosphate dehydrogenase [Parvibaculum sp.]MBO6666798.1 CBS domain-containing protein [Parvibaculum sp.]MBO6693643.1 CBS domain-containing protein [Parvibaculum sp.]MBO6713419.1 CBS domain-containing protein [Parvibaculum sp.]
MKVSEAMTNDVRIADPDETIEQAARTLAEIDAGALPVGEDDRLVGMITDRDIAIRAIAEGKGPETKVREVMTPDIRYCFDDQEIDEVQKNMGDNRVRRMAVLNHDKRLVGILSFADIALSGARADQALKGASQPGGPHAQ